MLTTPSCVCCVLRWVAAAGLFRVGEVVVDRANAQANAIDRLVCVRDLRVLQLKPLVVAIHLRASKTDVFRHGVDVKVCNSTAVQALFTYLQHRPTPITPDSPLFATDDCRPLTRKHLLSSVTALLAMAQIDTSGHAGVSFRRGGATSLAAAGVPDHLVKLLVHPNSRRHHRQPLNTALHSLPCLLTHVLSLRATMGCHVCRDRTDGRTRPPVLRPNFPAHHDSCMTTALTLSRPAFTVRSRGYRRACDSDSCAAQRE